MAANGVSPARSGAGAQGGVMGIDAIREQGGGGVAGGRLGDGGPSPAGNPPPAAATETPPPAPSSHAPLAAGATIAGGVEEGGARNAEPGTLAQGMSALFPDAPLAVQQALGRLVESGSTVTYYGKEGKKSTSQVWGALKTQVAAGLQRRVAAGNALQPGQAQPQGMPAELPHSYVGASSAEVRGIITALVDLGLFEMQANSCDAAPEHTFLLLVKWTRKSEEEPELIKRGVINLVHRVLLRLRLHGYPFDQDTDDPVVHSAATDAPWKLLRKALIDKAKKQQLELKDVKDKNTQALWAELNAHNTAPHGGAAAAPASSVVWGRGNEKIGAIDECLHALLMSASSKQGPVNLMRGVRISRQAFGVLVERTNLTDEQRVLLYLLQKDGPCLGPSHFNDVSAELVRPPFTLSTATVARSTPSSDTGGSAAGGKRQKKAACAEPSRVPLAEKVNRVNTSIVSGVAHQGSAATTAREVAVSDALCLERHTVKVMGSTVGQYISFLRPPGVSSQGQVKIRQGENQQLIFDFSARGVCDFGRDLDLESGVPSWVVNAFTPECEMAAPPAGSLELTREQGPTLPTPPFTLEVPLGRMLEREGSDMRRPLVQQWDFTRTHIAVAVRHAPLPSH